MINIRKFKACLLKIDKKSYKSVDIYYIGCVITKYLYDEDVDSVCPMYLINEIDGYIEKKMEINT